MEDWLHCVWTQEKRIIRQGKRKVISPKVTVNQSINISLRKSGNTWQEMLGCQFVLKMDIYVSSKDVDGVITSIKDDTIEPAIEIVLHETPRDIERKAEDVLLFKDIKSYLQIGRNFAVVNREDW